MSNGALAISFDIVTMMILLHCCKRIFRISGWLLLVPMIQLLLSGCRSEAEDCFKSTGKTVREERSLAPFTGIHLEDNIRVVLTNDSSGKIIVEAGKNLLPKIKTDVQGSFLMISNENTCNWVRSYKRLITLYIGVRNIKDIFHYGYGDMETEGFLNKDTLFVHHYGNGNIHLKLQGKLLWMDMDHLGDFTAEGSVNVLNARIYNLGRLRAENLQAQDAYVINDGQGDAYVRASGTVYAEIKNEGNVYYFGHPSNPGATITGSGKFVME